MADQKIRVSVLGLRGCSQERSRTRQSTSKDFNSATHAFVFLCVGWEGVGVISEPSGLRGP